MSGWATAVSWMVSASDVGAVGDEVDLGGVGEGSRAGLGKPGSSSHGVRKPGVWEPCPGQTMTSTWSSLCAGPDRLVRDADEPATLDL